jgi:hypothetical protein
MEKKFRKGEVVWAKVCGFPWWPGVVRTIKMNMQGGSSLEKDYKILVNFIGDNSHSFLPLSKIEKFQIKFNEYAKTKKKGLLASIKLAKKIIQGEIPFEKHLSFLPSINKEISNSKKMVRKILY